MWRTVADHHLGLAAEDRLHEDGDIFPAVLVVAVGVDDHVGAELERRVEAGLEGACEPEVDREAQQVGGACPLRNLGGPVLRPVVDDERLDRVEAGDRARQRGERLGEIPLLVVAGDLDDQLRHRPEGGTPSRGESMFVGRRDPDVERHDAPRRRDVADGGAHGAAVVGRHPGRPRSAGWPPPEPGGPSERERGSSEWAEHRRERSRPHAAEDRARGEERPEEHNRRTRPAAPWRWSLKGVGPVSTVAARPVAAVQVIPPVGFDEVEELVRGHALRRPESRDRLVDVPDEQALAGQARVGADPLPVLDEVIFLGPPARRRDLDDTWDLLDGRQADTAGRALDRLDIDPAEPELRPCARVGRALAEAKPCPLPHEPPDTDPFVRQAAWGVQLGEAEEMAELVTENAEVAERRHLLLRDDARLAEP